MKARNLQFLSFKEELCNSEKQHKLPIIILHKIFSFRDVFEKRNTIFFSDKNYMKTFLNYLYELSHVNMSLSVNMFILVKIT